MIDPNCTLREEGNSCSKLDVKSDALLFPVKRDLIPELRRCAASFALALFLLGNDSSGSDEYD